METQAKHKAKYSLQNYHCGNCETGVVQIHQSMNRKKEVTIIVSGCLDCGYDYGIRQTAQLNKYDRDDIVWA